MNQKIIKRNSLQIALNFDYSHTRATHAHCLVSIRNHTKYTSQHKYLCTYFEMLMFFG